jgi:hypothetical protein
MDNQSKVNDMVKSLILMYIKENYNQYLIDNKIKKIKDDKIRDIIKSLYIERKDHLRSFLKDSLKAMMKENYVGDLFVNNMCVDIFSDDEVCVNRLTMEIQNYQKNL